MMRVNLGTLAGGASPAWASNAGDKLLKKVKLHFGGSLTPIDASAEDLKALALVEHGEEIMADGFIPLRFGGAFPWQIFANGVRVQGNYAALADLTTGSPTSQSGTSVDFYSRHFPWQGKPRPVTGFPVIKTFETDLQSVSGDKRLHVLNSGNLLQYVFMFPNSGTLLDSTRIEIDDGNDVICDLPWDVHAEENKREFLFDTVQPSTGFRVWSFRNHLLQTDKDAVGKLELRGEVNSEASGKVRIVTVERMKPSEEADLLSRIQQ